VVIKFSTGDAFLPCLARPEGFWTQDTARVQTRRTKFSDLRRDDDSLRHVRLHCSSIRDAGRSGFSTTPNVARSGCWTFQRKGSIFPRRGEDWGAFSRVIVKALQRRMSESTRQQVRAWPRSRIKRSRGNAALGLARARASYCVRAGKNLGKIRHGYLRGAKANELPRSRVLAPSAQCNKTDAGRRET